MIISIANHKGGVGKSTTAQTLAIGLAQKNKKVLVVDTDPQGNTTATLRAENTENNLYTLLKGNSTIQDSIYLNKTFNVYIIPSADKLNSADKEFTTDDYILNMQYLLKDELDKVKSNYDFIIIDTPPNIGILTTNSLVASDKVIIPMLADAYSIKGLTDTTKLINGIKQKTNNKDIKIEGLLLTHYKAQTLINQGLRDAFNGLANQLNTKIFKTPIRDSIIFSDTQLNKDICIVKYPNHNASLDYYNFINEVLEDNKNE